MTNREWSVGESFSLADCSAAPALFYADWIRPAAARNDRIAVSYWPPARGMATLAAASRR
jgi:glutathione S-transferase